MSTIDLFHFCQCLVKVSKRCCTKGCILFLSNEKLIFDKQYGFRSNYSTTHALISLTERLKTYLDSGHIVAGCLYRSGEGFRYSKPQNPL